MRIGLIGYGKMGKEIEKIAIERGHHIAGCIDFDNVNELSSWKPRDIEVAIEFTSPDMAYQNIKTCIDNGIAVVSGTTGWLDKKPQLNEYCVANEGTFFYASNYSLGVNITFKVNQYLARIMNRFTDFSVSMEEVHHIQKIDAPSGTALTMAEGIIEEIDRLQGWALDRTPDDSIIPINSVREGQVPGTHSVRYHSTVDNITLQHQALSRQGFALGAVLVAEWLPGNSGVLGMEDFLEF